jgi:hypothetical protein
VKYNVLAYGIILREAFVVMVKNILVLSTDFDHVAQFVLMFEYHFEDGNDQ